VTNQSCKALQIISVERVLLKELSYRLSPPTCVHFFSLFLQIEARMRRNAANIQHGYAESLLPSASLESSPHILNSSSIRRSQSIDFDHERFSDGMRLIDLVHMGSFCSSRTLLHTMSYQSL
jgi:hypothetical protein